MENHLTKIIVALGSNKDQESNIDLAIEMLRSRLGDMRFSRKMWTKPIGMDSDLFLNVLGKGEVSASVDEIQRLLKSIETQCGRCRHVGQSGEVRIDIDLLLYGSERYHEADWQREYIQVLMNEIEPFAEM